MIKGIITENGVYEVKQASGVSPCASCDLSGTCDNELECEAMLGDEHNFRYSPDLSYLLADGDEELMDGDAHIGPKDVVAGWFFRKLVKNYKKHDAKRTEALRQMDATIKRMSKQLRGHPSIS